MILPFLEFYINELTVIVFSVWLLLSTTLVKISKLLCVSVYAACYKAVFRAVDGCGVCLSGHRLLGISVVCRL